ncbi:MAG: phosphate/phosphite/phosphonate ABC transporter substrate-binding protein [Defluviitaleaceae bacterium]|nr:phosphate/phosphite/phosphonate ABC transporter substrate-binding protein [Defluviitaleaceae bacterium]
MYKKLVCSAILCLLAVGLLAACAGGYEGESEIERIRIALLIEDAAPELRGLFEDFRAAMEEHIGMPVEVIEGATHLVGIEAMRAGNLEMMWGSPFVYLLAGRDMDVYRLAVTDSPTAVNKTVFITACDDINSLDDLRGRSLAFINRSSTSGFIYPMYDLMNHFGMTQDEIMVGGLFSAVDFAGNQNAAIMGVIHGHYDAAAVGNLNLQNVIRSGLISEGDVRVFASSEVIPFPGYIASGRLSYELRVKITEFLLAYENEEYFASRFNNDPSVRFVAPDVQQIEHLRSMVEALGIDLEEQG